MINLLAGVRLNFLSGILFFCLLSSGIVQAGTLENIDAHLEHRAVNRGTFTQERFVTGFKASLRSNGRYIVAREAGIVWQTEKPFASTLILRQDKIIARQDTKTTLNLDAAQEPGIALINRLLFAVLAGDFRLLGEYFELHTQMNGPQWQVQLTPKNNPIGKQYKSIQLQGDTQVRHVSLIENTGDRTEIDLTAASGKSSDTLNKEERSYFE